MSLYNIIRIAIAILLSIILIFTINKKINPNKIKKAIAIVILCCFSFASFLELIPFENNFIFFRTPQDAIHYYANDDIEHIIYGESTCLVIIESENNTRQILKEKDGGWEIHTAFEIKKSHMKLINTNAIYILSLKNSTDKYIYISSVFGNKLNIYDNINSVFYKTTRGDYYAFISDFSNEYTLYINNEKIFFE